MQRGKFVGGSPVRLAHPQTRAEGRPAVCGNASRAVARRRFRCANAAGTTGGRRCRT